MKLKVSAHHGMHLFILINPITQFFTRFEVRDELAVQAYRVTGLGIAPNSRGTKVQGKTTKATNLDTIASR